MLASNYRLKKQKDFEAVYKRGRKKSGPFFNLSYAPNPALKTRFAFVMSKKEEKRVTQRNLAKRRFRAIVKEYQAQVKEGLDVVIMIKAKALTLNFQELKTEASRLFKEAKLLK